MSTIANIIESSREIMQDEVAPYRFSDDRLVRATNGAFREVFRIRPDLFLGVSYVLPTYTTADLTDPSTTFPIEEQYYNTVVEFVVGWTELSDDEFVLDGRAAALLTAFRNQLVGPNILGGGAA